jgi:outer membrane protein OmpA-like peptidoglycan-associated protein
VRVSTLLAAAIILALPAQAQNDPFARGIDLVPIKLTPLMNSGLTLDSAELDPAKSWQLMALLDFNVGILSLKLGDQRLGDLLPFRAELHLMGAYQLHPRIEVAADLPITFAQVGHFNLLTDQGFPQDNPRVAGLGAPRIFGRFQLLKQSELPIVGLAAILELRIPIGDQFSFLSDRGFVFAPRLAIERSFGPLRILGNLGWRLRTAVGQYLNLYLGQEFTIGGGVILALPDLWKFRDNQLIGELNLATAAEAPFTFRDAESLKTPFELMVGVRTHVTEHWRAQFSIGKGLGANGYGRETIRFSIGLTYESLPEPDADGDGVPDRVDRCPEQAGTKALEGCPEPTTPELVGTPDRDHDGVPDNVDLCPDKPGPVQLDGCPDRDGDQIPDISDKCPDKPGPPALEGCPPPEEEEDVVLESERIKINNQILFDFGSDRIAAQSLPLLNDVAKVLGEHREVGPVMIEGHTDNVGPRALNIELSRRRAHAVETYLIGRGVDRKRLRSEGYGFDRPLVPNDNPLNRARNRRTEFKLLEEVETVPPHVKEIIPPHPKDGGTTQKKP